MRIQPLAITATGILLLAGLTPASAAFADDLTVTGTVTLDGAARGGVEVGWYDPTTDASGETVTDAVGAYSLSIASGHPYVLYAGLDHDPVPKNVNDAAEWRPTGGADYVGVFVGTNGTDYLYQSLTSFTTPLADRNIDLDKPGTIAGTNPALANKRIALENLDRGRLGSVRADAAGHFELAGLLPGRYRLSLSGSQSKADIAAYLSPTITVSAGATSTLDPVLEKRGTITGVVTNRGKPVKGVKITSYLGSSYGSGDVTDAKGRYTLSKESPGSYLVVVEEGTDDGGLVDRSVMMTTRKATVAAGDTTKLDIAVRKGGSVSGTIPATKLDGVRVFVVDTKGELAGGAYVTTSATKPTAFTISAVETGAATVFVPGGTNGATYGSAPVTVRGGVTTSVGTIALTKKTVSLSGRVVGTTTGTVGYSSNTYALPSGSGKVKNGRYTITGLLPIPGTVSLGITKTRLGKEFAAIPGSGDVTVRPGAVRPQLTGILRAGEYPLLTGRSSIWLPGRSDDIGAVSIKNGLLTGTRLRLGTGRIDLTRFDRDSPFVENSPFYLKMPSASARITLKAGKSTDLGSVQLVIHR